MSEITLFFHQGIPIVGPAIFSPASALVNAIKLIATGIFASIEMCTKGSLDETTVDEFQMCGINIIYSAVNVLTLGFSGFICAYVAKAARAGVH